MSALNPNAVKASQIFREEFRRQNPLSVSIGILHLFFILFLVFGSIALCLVKIRRPMLSELMAIPFMLVFGNLVIYLLHRFVLHVPRRIFRYGFEMHTLMHHRYFTYELYGFASPWDLDVILFPFWFVFFLSLLLAPTLGLGASLFASANTAYLVVLMTNLDYLLYETVHYSSHLEEGSWAHRLPLLRFMRRHHRIHHKKTLEAAKNFDIILPLFDPIFGTLYLKTDEEKSLP